MGYDAGREFHYAREDIKYLRLSYAHLGHDDIIAGAEILADCIKEAVQDRP